MTKVEEKSLIYGYSRMRKIAAIKAVFGFLSITFCLSLVTELSIPSSKTKQKKQLTAPFCSNIWEMYEDILRQH